MRDICLGVKQNIHNFSNNFVQLKGEVMKKEIEKIVLPQLAKTPQARTMASADSSLGLQDSHNKSIPLTRIVMASFLDFIVLMLLSAHAERVRVSHMQHFFQLFNQLWDRKQATIFYLSKIYVKKLDLCEPYLFQGCRSK